MQVTSFRGSRTQLADRGFSFAIMPCDWPNYRPPLLAPRSSLLSLLQPPPALIHFCGTSLLLLVSSHLLFSLVSSTLPLIPSLPPLFTPSLAPLLSFPLYSSSACSARLQTGWSSSIGLLSFPKKRKEKEGGGGEYLHLNFCKKHIKRQHGGDGYLDSTCVFFISLHAGKTGSHACFSFLSSPR